MEQFGKKLGKLSLAILENFVEDKLGKKFVDELRSPTDRALAIETALEHVEERFQKEFSDKDLGKAIFVDLPVDKTTLGNTIGKFFDHPTDSDFPESLTSILTSEFAQLSPERIKTAVSFYIKLLKQEFALADETFREKIRALADLETLEYLRVLGEELKNQNISIGRNKRLPIQSTLAQTELPTFNKNEPLPSPSDLPLGSYLPFSRNPLFTGRKADLISLAESLLKQNSSTVINQAIAGMGGLGKTQLAVEFAYRYGKFFRGVHWLNLANPESLNGEIASCGAQMGLDNFPEEQPSQVTLTLNTWKADGPRLLILDNFEQVELVNDVMKLLNHSNIRVLITSRRSDWPPTSGLHPLPLELFTKEESLAFLKESMKQRADKDDELKALSERLGFLPLALELASRYLNGHPRLTVTVYLKQAKESLAHPSMKNWRTDLPAATGHDLDLQRTFAFSWLALKDVTAQKIFLAAGYLAPNTAIPLEIFEKTFEISSEQCDESLALLYGSGLLRESDAQPTIHPLLAEYAGKLSKEDTKILEALGDTFATISKEVLDTGLPARFDLIKPHIPVLALYAENKNIRVAGALWNNYGIYLRMIADYSNAFVAYERASKIDPDDAIYINNLGKVMKDQGDLVGARAAYERAIKIWEADLGTEHPQVATGVNNLGSVMKDQGDLASARTAFERALKIFEANLGEDHPNVATLVNNLGFVMQAQGDLSGARAAFERALKIDEASLGSDHPNVARDINNLGGVMHNQGDLGGALAAYERAIKIWEANLGIEHPQVAYGINNLGFVMQAQGDLIGARVAFERALAIFKKFLPPEHPNIKVVQGNLDALEK
ncbi:MAG: tetratricopeptide repeat protein [Chloroflexi bacterium]|nr:tetratricopeptide repeat protein [Chloroflexota bacterium]